MESRQYTIGEFAAINKVSARMLRHYDKTGLFRPAAILPNGYRAYFSEQIATLARIRQFQGCGFTLSEVGELLHAGGEEIAARAKEKQLELRAREWEASGAYERLCALLGQPRQAYENRYALSYTLQEERYLLLADPPVAEEQIEASFDRLFDALHTAGIAPAGPVILLCEGAGDAVYRAAAPASEGLSCDGFTIAALAEGWYLSTLHFGAYDRLAAAYDRLLRYADEQKRSLSPPFLERYFLDQTHTANPEEYISEISVKITP